MTKAQTCSAALLLVSVAYGAARVAADESANAAKLLLQPNTESVNAPRGDISKIGSVATGCLQCRDSGNCSIAMNDTSSGVFCGDLHTAATVQACCCPYYTECRVTSTSSTCECGGSWSLPVQLGSRRHERLSATEAADEAEPRVEDEPIQDPLDNQMSVSTEILIHLSAYLALFVFAVYVDQWVECFSDFRRNQMVAYGEAVDIKLLRFRQRFGKRRRDSEAEIEANDNLPLLVLQSPAPISSSAFPFDDVPEAEIIDTSRVEGGKDFVEEQTVVVTVPQDVVQEVSISPSETPSELQEIPLE
ncbi:unnamed protein product [Phytophthora fragariaefolia]|uniref:Unnamed protein product n=1 Tax=Phytophthora fragariaefolia TaxID=1490495 RepID=A0A9W6YHL7_9STRA|nr:unnamed protein product [Phytophthora fragariaefolia]